MFQLLGSLFKRVVTVVTTPFRMLIVRIQRLFNINIISAKLAAPLRKTVKKLITLRPQSREDYFVVGKWWVYKKLLLTLVLVICAGVFIYFNMFASKLPAAMPTAAAVKTDVTFDYNDMDLRSFTGVANIRASDGAVVYTGDIVNGVCTGTGVLWNREGKLLYQGGFNQNQYSGQGTSSYPSGNKRYEGNWENNLYNGSGKLYADNGALIYDGGMKDGLFDGPGKAYSNTGVLLYDGNYSAGLYHGYGISYYSDGTTHYEGEFLGGLAQGEGKLYDSSGKLLYTGYMYAGRINYRALLGSSFQDIKAAFAEHPRVFYTENECAFVFEQAGIVVTVDCRVQVDTWEKNASAEDNRDYYMPGDDWGKPAAEAYGENAPGGEYVSPAPGAHEESAADEYTWEETLPGEESTVPIATGSALTGMRHLAAGPSAPEIRQVDWYMVEEEEPGSFQPPGSPDSPETSGPDIQPDTEPDAQQGQSGAAALQPDFIQKNLTLYFEIDTNVWQSEAALDASKIQVKRITAFSRDLPPVAEEAVEFQDNSQPFIEDCVAIDFIRQRQPTAFPQVVFEADRQNKLFVPITNINYASKIARKAYLLDDVTYRYAYNQPEDETPLYLSLER